MRLTIPESLRWYFDPQNREAVNSLLDMEELPREIVTLEDARSFYKAELAARRVRTEYWMLCHDLWNSTWGEALKSMPLAQAKWGKECPISLENVWVDGLLVGFEFGDGLELSLIVYAEEDGIQIGFYVEGRDCSISNGLRLSDSWKTAEEDIRWTREAVLPLSAADDEVDVAELALLAKEATAALSRLRP